MSRTASPVTQTAEVEVNRQSQKSALPASRVETGRDSSSVPRRIAEIKPITMILNGEIQDVSQSEAARQGSYQWMYPQQRICIVQTGKLEYAIVEVYGKTDSSAGMTLQQFAQFVAEKCPDAIIAYNLDGGGSTNLIINGKRVCKTPGIREVTDILYFASAEE